jgi:hypothetical protein
LRRPRGKWLVAGGKSCRHSRKADISDHRCVISIYYLGLFLVHTSFSLFLSLSSQPSIQSIQFDPSNSQTTNPTAIMRFSAIFVLASATAAMAANSTPALFARQSTGTVCSNGESVCGSGCYDPTAYTCCGEQGQVCATGNYCASANRCCPNGANCDGQGTSTASGVSATAIQSGSTILGSCKSMNFL